MEEKLRLALFTERTNVFIHGDDVDVDNPKYTMDIVGNKLYYRHPRFSEALVELPLEFAFQNLPDEYLTEHAKVYFCTCNWYERNISWAKPYCNLWDFGGLDNFYGRTADDTWVVYEDFYDFVKELSVENREYLDLLIALNKYSGDEGDGFEQYGKISEIPDVIPLAYTTSDNGDFEVRVEFDLKNLKWKEYINEDLFREEKMSLHDFIDKLNECDFMTVLHDVLAAANIIEENNDMSKYEMVVTYTDNKTGTQSVLTCSIEDNTVVFNNFNKGNAGSWTDRFPLDEAIGEKHNGEKWFSLLYNWLHDGRRYIK